ncbi:YozE family protein [Gottfriedia acidiceleris]|uniref:UPF0346 protein MY490_10110 n=1 Tax=Gottfriedia acidiceleris TaxID=371036 RepID=A0ABY4JSU8_9BACI|nr:YozE family protein [Gottfriedia acidiceleris]UPM56155.1 YozE family protein [Gottfriedia acidiceleris]
MRKSFYHYMMKHRNYKIPNEIGKLADHLFNDHSFPKHSSSYDEISSYLEFDGTFHQSMSVFDEAWNLYLEDQ